MSLREDAYQVLRENLLSVKPDLSARDVILCPICNREIPHSEVATGGIEHIIPQNIVKKDVPGLARLGTKNQRCGITVLCRSPRTCQSDGKLGRDGCNGIKGRLYDRLFRGLFDTETHDSSQFTHAHGVAILIMAYLGAFQNLGYEYILRPELDSVREQFDFPNHRRTPWLDHARYNLAENEMQIVATSSGQPFIIGGRTTEAAPLEVMFRRCHALLPRGHWSIQSGVRHLNSLLS